MIPLSLYVHIPWCVKKCPYCDFNSHVSDKKLPEESYVTALKNDLLADAHLANNRKITSIFFGGGTPSLFSAKAFAEILKSVEDTIGILPNAEITLEANPGTAEHDKFARYLDAGINRLSMGIQSFNDHHLQRLGRIHDGHQAHSAIELARSAGFKNFNLDLIHGLEDQTPEQANTNGTLTFTGTDGETHTISIPITDDIIVEDPEQFELILENLSTNLIPILSSDRSVITIQDNDGNEGWPQDFTAEACDTIPDPETIVVNSSCTTEVSFNEVIEGTDDGCATEYTIRRTWTFTDCVGNTRTHEQLITVVDTVAPTFNEDLPQSGQVSCEDVPVAATLTAMDGCEGPLDVVFDEVISNQDACGTNYTITRTWTASDCAGNAITHTQVLEVRDEMAPSFVEELPQSVTVECNEVPAPVVLTAVDNCDTVVEVVFEESASGDLNCADGFQITRVWTATDCSGNTISHTQVITVDPTGPIVAGPYEEEVTVLCYQEVPPVPEMNFMGGCGDYQVEFTEEVEDVDSSSDYLIVRTWVVTDACGNQESFEQIIFVMQPQLEEVSFSICVEDDPVNLFDYLPEYFDQNGQFAIRQGDVTLEGSTFNPGGLEVGEYLIAYSSKAGTCEFLADFIIDVNSDCVPCTRDKIEVSETVTVNADGKNDYFEIKGVEYCPYEFDVMIFNRWGDKVYEKKNYQNDWGGYAPRNAVGSAGTVPSGTYYYIISVLDTESNTRLKPVNGYIYIGAE